MKAAPTRPSVPAWVWVILAIVAAAGLGYVLGLSNKIGLSLVETIYFMRLLLFALGAGLCLWLSVRLALRPRPARGATEWHKIPWQTGVVIRLTDQGLWLGCMVLATGFAAAMLPPDTIRALLGGP